MKLISQFILLSGNYPLDPKICFPYNAINTCICIYLLIVVDEQGAPRVEFFFLKKH